ncbi:MAG: PilN domain-containing protein [candidate division Zixibacteria bacterium]|nr:PilN domain-containing protein [candidate division Zixibacteria bacterium]
MIEINLLPKELKRRGKGFAFDKNLIYVGMVAGGLVILFVVVSIFQSFKLKALDEKITGAKKRTEELRKNIELVDALTDLKDKLLRRMSAIETLDKNRATWVQVLEDLSQRVPEYLWLSALWEEEVVSESQAGTEADTSIETALSLTPTRKVNIEGYTYSISSLALFLIRLTRSDYFKNMELQFIKKSEAEKQKTFSFGLSGKLVYNPETQVESLNDMEIAQK